MLVCPGLRVVYEVGWGWELGGRRGLIIIVPDEEPAMMEGWYDWSGCWMGIISKA
jgi:hypothetical protein